MTIDMPEIAKVSVFTDNDLTHITDDCKRPFLLFFVLVVCWFSCSFVSEACAGFEDWL